MASRFVPTPMNASVEALSEGDRKALAKLIEAGYLIDRVFLRQIWGGNDHLFERLSQDQSALGKARFHLFWLSKGPWYDLDEHRSFIPGTPQQKPPGANFYPEDMTKEEFERWEATLSPAQALAAKSFFTVIRRNPTTHGLTIVPYHVEYGDLLTQAAERLREASALTSNPTLKRFLETRAAAFLNDDYFESDVAWMDLDAPIDITIGPYETYNDEVFGYKAGFEAYVCLKDEAETNKVKDLSRHLQDVEDHLPIDPKYRNRALGSTTPIRVVNELLAAGDGNHGVQTAAYNLPNDEKVIQQKGSKKVMLKNVQHAKFDLILKPVASLVLSPRSRADLSFDWFFTHILAHELSHGIGPHEIRKADKVSSVRLELKDLYSTIEEAKADVTGLFMLQHFFDTGVLPGGPEVERQLYNTFLASSFRTLRFGITEAHGRGMALQFNYFLDRGAFVMNPDGTFAVDFAKVKPAVRELTHELLTIEAQGDYASARAMLDRLCIIRPAMSSALSRLDHLPVDIEPQFTTARQLAPWPNQPTTR